jgi:hypothetical protein
LGDEHYGYVFEVFIQLHGADNGNRHGALHGFIPVYIEEAEIDPMGGKTIEL